MAEEGLKIGVKDRIVLSFLKVKDYFSSMTNAGVALSIAAIIFVISVVISIPIFLSDYQIGESPEEKETGIDPACESLAGENYMARACKDFTSVRIDVVGSEGERTITDAVFYINGEEVGEFSVEEEVVLLFGDRVWEEVANVSMAPISKDRALCPISHDAVVVSCSGELDDIPLDLIDG